ncbi:putative transcriptional regulatory protein YesN [Paenibacillus macerans]|uniref:response regulator n=1 Tax=Paenibacillus sp. FSL R5-0527 TaxID=2975321 RepID=UPI00097B56BB|nr:DNA-binding response regulator [Paenibacillus macerans]GJM68592.1 putative transcriptional regulatory protein YesN [Paenibacillus macerans]
MSYKVLLADDEQIIVQGISSIVDWEALDTELVATAENGIDAYEKMARLEPDIVISDIRMPGMDGLSLVSKAHQEFPAMKFILLSGYSEFEYARTAMRYGVKNYLLKPCNEDKITAALQEIIHDLEQEKAQDTLVSQLQEKYAKAQPLIKAHLLTEFLAGRNYSNNDLSFYQQLFDVEIHHQRVRLVLFKPEGSYSYEHLFAIKNIGAEILDSVLLSMNMGENAVFLIEDDHDAEKLRQKIERIKELACQYFKKDTTVAISEGDHIHNAGKLYREAMECLEHRFYLGEGSIITRKDVLAFKSKHSSVIIRVIEVLAENLGNPALSLKMVANEILYMNPDYLGKLFKQETGQRFSTYLTKLRIEKAVEHIAKMDDVKVGTLAEIVGFGDNPQYFSQVFKKYTGCTPSEYRKREG